MLASVSRRYPEPKGRFPRVTHPCATKAEAFVRLACVRHAASVRSEPGSNSQVQFAPQPEGRRTTVKGPPRRGNLNLSAILYRSLAWLVGCCPDDPCVFAVSPSNPRTPTSKADRLRIPSHNTVFNCSRSGPLRNRSDGAPGLSLARPTAEPRIVKARTQRRQAQRRTGAAFCGNPHPSGLSPDPPASRWRPPRLVGGL